MNRTEQNRTDETLNKEVCQLPRIRQATKQGWIECNIGGIFDGSYPESKKRRGRVQRNGETCPTLMASTPNLYRIELNGDNDMAETKKRYRIRKLTPNECWRLQGIRDDEFHKAESVNSNSQLYKEAGNGICVAVMAAIFSQLHIQGHKAWNDMTDDERYQLVGYPKNLSKQSKVLE